MDARPARATRWRTRRGAALAGELPVSHRQGIIRHERGYEKPPPRPKSRKAGLADPAGQGGGGGLMARCDGAIRATARAGTRRARRDRTTRSRRAPSCEKRDGMGTNASRTYADTAVDVSFVHTRNLHTRRPRAGVLFLPSVYLGGRSSLVGAASQGNHDPSARSGVGAGSSATAGRGCNLVASNRRRAPRLRTSSAATTETRARRARSTHRLSLALHSSRSAAAPPRRDPRPPSGVPAGGCTRTATMNSRACAFEVDVAEKGSILRVADLEARRKTVPYAATAVRCASSVRRSTASSPSSARTLPSSSCSSRRTCSRSA